MLIKNIDVLIYYEHIARELQSALLLKKELEKNNLSVILYKIRWNESLSHLKYRPKIIVTPWCYGDEEVDYIQKMWQGSFPKKQIKIVCLNCEQLSGKSGQTYVVPKGRAKSVIHFAWGEYFKELLINNNINKENVFITGSICNDFYKKPYSLANLKKEELSKKYNLDINKKWILLIGNFSGKNLTENQLISAEEKGFSSIRKLSELAQSTFKELLKWYRLASSKFENLEFIYRPHPNENITEDILKIEDDFNNFHIIKDLPIREWIVNSDIAYEWFSTSAVEVSFSSIPVYSLMPFKIPDDLIIPLIDKVEKIYTDIEFIENLNNFNNNLILKYNEEFKKSVSYYYSLDEKACTKSASIIFELLNNEIGLIDSHLDFWKLLIGTFRFCAKKIFLKFGIVPKHTNDTVINDIKLSKNYNEYVERIDRIYDKERKIDEKN